MAPQPEKKKSKLPMILGGCCLLILIASCGVGIWMYFAAQNAAEELGGSFEAEMNRISLSVTLDGIMQTCAGDPTGAAASSFFNAGVAGTYSGLACTTNADTVAAFSDASRSTASNLAGSADEFHAIAQGIDANTCFVFTSGSAKVIGCSQVDGFKLLHIESLNMVQP